MDCNLSHLVEAATALTRLNSPRAPAFETSNIVGDLSSVVSDDDSNKKGPNVVVDAVVTPPRSVTTVTAVNSSNNNNNNKNNTKEIFPQRLMAVLGDAALVDIISWLPHGRSFVIIRPDVFTDEIMPKHFPPMDARASSKYPSFTRKLNRWYVEEDFTSYLR
jgi:HSF-type DNA-binding